MELSDNTIREIKFQIEELEFKHILTKKESKKLEALRQLLVEQGET